THLGGWGVNSQKLRAEFATDAVGKLQLQYSTTSRVVDARYGHGVSAQLSWISCANLQTAFMTGHPMPLEDEAGQVFVLSQIRQACVDIGGIDHDFLVLQANV
ncbi:MAG: hypothetical protein RLZZ602_2084, partial [Pseudomonadota bacterium]